MMNSLLQGSPRSDRAPGAGADRLRRRGARLVPAALAAAALGLLVLLLAGGYWLRPAADDWGYQFRMRTMGLRTFVSLLYFGSNGRIGNAVLLNLVHRQGLLGLALFPALLLLPLLLGLTVLVRRAWRATGREAPWPLALLLAAVATLVYVLACPQPYQTAYWASGAISHSAPAVLAVALLALSPLGRPGRAQWLSLGAAVPGFAFIALVSEAAALVAVLLALLLQLPGRRWLTEADDRRFAVRYALAVQLGTVLGLVVEFLSPGMRGRSDSLGVDRAPLAQRLLEGLGTWLHDLGTTVTDWRYLPVLLAGLLLGLAAPAVTGTPRFRAERVGRAWLWTAAAVLLASLAVTELVQLVFGDWVWYLVRTWNDWRLPYVLLLAATGAVLGLRLGDRAGTGRSGAVRAVGLGLAALGVLALAVPTATLLEQTRHRAHHWDRQDSWVRAQLARGSKHPGYVPSYIGGIRDAYTGSGAPEWVRGDVDLYYGTRVHLHRGPDWDRERLLSPTR